MEKAKQPDACGVTLTFEQTGAILGVPAKAIEILVDIGAMVAVGKGDARGIDARTVRFWCDRTRSDAQ